jgi:hypothetical protein
VAGVLLGLVGLGNHHTYVRQQTTINGENVKVTPT